MIKDSASAEPDPQDTLKTHRFGRDFGEGEEGGDGNKEGHTAKGYNARNIEKKKRKKEESVDEGTRMKRMRRAGTVASGSRRKGEKGEGRKKLAANRIDWK